MRKIFSLFAAILFAASMMADSYTITFKDGGTDSDKTSSLTSTTVSDYVDAGAEYVSAIAPTGKVYFAKTGAGLKFGNSSGGGSVTLTLATPIKPTSIVISASQFGASEGSGLFQEETFDMTGGGGKYAFNDYTVTYDGETEVATISVGTAKRGYVNSITVNYASQGGEEPVVEPTTKTIYLNGGGSSLWNQANPEFFVHSWGGAADGDVHMTLVEGDVYKADIPADNTNLLFLRLATGTTEIVWSGDAHWNQSTDQTIPEGKDLFTMTSWDNGEWSVYTAQGGDDPVVEPEVTLPVVAIAGTMNEWSAEANVMVAAEDSLSASVKIALEAQKYEFKVVSDGQWLSLNGEGETLYGIHREWNEVAHINGVDLRNFELTADVAGEYTFTWTYADSTLLVTFPEKPAEPVVDEWVEIKFSEVVSSDDLAEDATFSVAGSTFAAQVTDPDNKMQIDANSCSFGTADAYVSYSHRLKTGGKSSATKNFITLTIPEDGTLNIAVRTGSNSATDRSLVVKQGETELFNQVILESSAIKVMEGETEVSVYPYITVPVKAGSVLLNYPVSGINFYAFAFKASETPDPVEPQPVDSMTVYYVNETAWENVNAYVWPAEGDAYKDWPGEAMTKEAEQINGFDVYSYKFPASYVNLIFNNGNGGEGNQTSDLVWDATKPYFFDGEWYASVEEVAPHCAQVTEGIWTVTETTPLDANSIYVHNNLMKMKPAYAAAWDGFYNPQQFGEYSFTYAMLIRSEAWPTEQIPAGVEYVGGNKNTTSLIVEAKEDIDITIFYRRQTGNQSENDSKDLKIFDHSAITTAIQGVFQIVELDGDYFSATKKLSLVKGHRYTITAKGTTPKIFAIAYGQPAEPDPAKFYVTGDSALIADAAPAGTVAWASNAIKSENDTLVLNLKAGVDYQLSLTVDGTWNTKKTYANLTQEDKSGLYDVDGDNHNIGFKLNEAGEVKVVYFVKDEVLTFKLIGNFYVDQTPVIEPEDTYTVAGNNTTLFGSSWDPTDTNNDMALVEGIYKWEKSEVALAQGTVEFKVVKDHNWNYGSYPADNYQLAIPADGIYTVTITFDPANLTVDATALKTGDAEVEKHYLVVGQAMVANGEDWNNDADINLMTSADEGLTYTLEIADLQLIAGTLYRYKIVEKGSWVEYFPKHVDNSDTCFTVPQDGIYTITYVYTVATSLCEVQAQRTGDLPAARLTDGYYLVGNFSGVPAWSVDGLTDAQRFVEVESDEYGTYYSLTADLAVDDSIKVVKIVHDAIVLWMPEGTGNNVVIDANHAGEAKIIHLAVAVTGEWSYYVEPNIRDGFYLLGSLNNWTPSDEYRFGKDATCGENEFVLNTTLAENDEIKVAKVVNGVATTWYPEGEGNNYVVDADHEGVKAIYFQETYKEDWVAFGGYFWMGENGGTAISNTAADAEAVKVLHNGMLLIRKGNKTYNIMGQAIK